MSKGSYAVFTVVPLDDLIDIDFYLSDKCHVYVFINSIKVVLCLILRTRSRSVQMRRHIVPHQLLDLDKAART